MIECSSDVLGLFDVFKPAKAQPSKVKDVVEIKIFSKEKCSECSKQFGEGRIYYTYPGKKKGSLEITKEKLLCKDCLEKQYNTSNEPDTKRNASIILALQLKDQIKLKQALEDLDKDRSKDDSSYWYTRGNILSNMKDFDGALKSYDEALFLDTHYIKAWYRKGNILGPRKDFDNVVKCYENIMVLDVNNRNEDRSWYKAALILKAVTILLEWGEIVREAAAKAQHIAGKEQLKEREIKKVVEKAKKKYEAQYKSEDVARLLKQVYDNIKTNKNIRGLPSEDLIDAAIKAGKFADILVLNYNEILDAVEPNVVAEFSLRWSKH